MSFLLSAGLFPRCSGRPACGRDFPGLPFFSMKVCPRGTKGGTSCRNMCFGGPVSGATVSTGFPVSFIAVRVLDSVDEREGVLAGGVRSPLLSPLGSVLAAITLSSQGYKVPQIPVFKSSPDPLVLVLADVFRDSGQKIFTLITRIPGSGTSSVRSAIDPNVIGTGSAFVVPAGFVRCARK